MNRGIRERFGRLWCSWPLVRRNHKVQRIHLANCETQQPPGASYLTGSSEFYMYFFKWAGMDEVQVCVLYAFPFARGMLWCLWWLNWPTRRFMADIPMSYSSWCMSALFAYIIQFLAWSSCRLCVILIIYGPATRSLGLSGFSPQSKRFSS